MAMNKPEKFSEFLRYHELGGPETKFKEESTPDPDIEENTGVDFQGH